MHVDKTTLADLSIFHGEEAQSVFHHLNFTHTNGGREYLRALLNNPLSSVTAIRDTQQTIFCLQQVLDEWPVCVTNGTIMMIEKFYDSQINHAPDKPSQVEAFFYKTLNPHDFSLMRYSVSHAIDFAKGLQQIVTVLQKNTVSRELSTLTSRISILLSKPVIQKMIAAEKKELRPTEIISYGSFFQNTYKSAALELVDIYSRLDAYQSFAIACKQYRYTFPDITQLADPFVQAKSLYHPLLETPVSYEVSLAKDKNFLFLTGANMAGKSTFIKAVGISVYLAHIGMGVPAAEMQLSFFDGLLSNIQVVDNILKGESFFFNEVQRIKNTIEKISDGRNWLILIDELFKGTNQQDAVTCSITVIEGLQKMKNALFVLSTHLYEIGDELKKHGNIQFYYFETAVLDDQLAFSYQLKEGISNDRLGYLILKREGVVDLLEKI